MGWILLLPFIVLGILVLAGIGLMWVVKTGNEAMGNYVFGEKPKK